MSEAPVRIWATVNGARTRFDLDRNEPSFVARERYVIGGWQGITDSNPRATEYVRADIVEELRAALDGLLEPFRDDPCHKDHHGYCQAHFLEEECCVAVARTALSRLAEVSNNG